MSASVSRRYSAAAAAVAAPVAALLQRPDLAGPTIGQRLPLDDRQAGRRPASEPRAVGRPCRRRAVVHEHHRPRRPGTPGRAAPAASRVAARPRFARARRRATGATRQDRGGSGSSSPTGRRSHARAGSRSTASHARRGHAAGGESARGGAAVHGRYARRTMAIPASAEVVVVGGGVMGASALYHLARAGCRDCVLVERETLGVGLDEQGGRRHPRPVLGRAQHPHRPRVHPPLRALRRGARRRDRLQAVGLPLPADDRGATSRPSRRSVALQQSLGVPSRLITPDEAGGDRAGVARGRRARGDVLPARRVRDARGRRAGLRDRSRSPRGRRSSRVAAPRGSSSSGPRRRRRDRARAGSRRSA